MANLTEGWESCAAFAGTGDGASDQVFLRMKDGDTIAVVVVGPPVGVVQVWDEVEGHSVEFDATKHDPREKKKRFGWNCYDTATKTIRILELSTTTFRDLLKIKGEQGGTLDGTLLKITRKGARKDTIYWIDVVKQLTEPEAQKVQTIYRADAYDLQDMMSGNGMATAAPMASAAPALTAVPAPMVPAAPAQPAAPAPMAPAAPAPMAPAAPADHNPMAAPGQRLDLDLF